MISWQALVASRAAFSVQPPVAPSHRAAAGGALCGSGQASRRNRHFVDFAANRKLLTSPLLRHSINASCWPSPRVAAGFGVCIALRAARRVGSSSSGFPDDDIIQAPPSVFGELLQQEFMEALDEFRHWRPDTGEEEPPKKKKKVKPVNKSTDPLTDWENEEIDPDNPFITIGGKEETQKSVIERYLDTATDPWTTDYTELEPLLEGQAGDEIEKLEAWKEKGKLVEINYRSKQLKDGRLFVLVECDVQGCGFVAGTGLAESEDTAKQLAAKQALERMLFPANASQEIKSAADAVRNHKHHSGARMPAIQAAETLEALEGKLEDVHVLLFQPCGHAWQASISCMCFDVRVVGPSADYDRQTALALAGEIFMSRLRWYVRVPAEDPHEPQMWAATWEQRKASRDKPWSGRSSVLSYEILRLSMLGSNLNVEDRIRALVPDQSSTKSRGLRLKELQSIRCGRSKEVQRNRIESSKAPTSEAPKRMFEVTPSDKDPRRKSLHGKLPAEDIRGDLGKALEKSQVVLVSGGTGSGKTTQLPQFLIDDWRGDGESKSGPKVVVTQPRRIAAISVAERVAWEREDKLGNTVGYAVHGNSIFPSSQAGSIEFVTVGTLLRRAVDDSALHKYDIVVVDEVHERDLLTDFLLILLREVLPLRPDLRLVLMSATLDVDAFTNYFKNCPVLEVQSGPLHPVEELHLEDKFFEDISSSSSLLNSEASARSASAAAVEETEDELSSGAAGQLRWAGAESGDGDRLLDVAEGAIRKVVEDTKGEDRGAVLCFLPGWSEIRKLQDRFQRDKGMWVLPLHSTLPKERQAQVFEKAPKGKTKIILGTNIAESSVTIDDVETVLDAGLQRQLTYDPKRRMSSLDTVWVSQSGAIQRRGRAGRVRAGRVLRLYSREQMEGLPTRASPEMQRCDLAQSCLQAVALGRDPRKFLADALDPPSIASVDTAMEQLVAIDAIDQEDRDNPPLLRPVGEMLARLPLEPLLGRATMLGCLLGVPEQTAALLVVSGGRSPFTGNAKEVVDAQKEFCDWSDPLAAAKALLAWEDRVRSQGEKKAISWAEQKRLSHSRLAGLSRDKVYLLRDMRRSGLLKQQGMQPSEDEDAVAEPNKDSAELLETRGEMEESMLEVEQEDQAETESIGISDESVPLLTAVLCSAYPASLAVQSKEKASNFKLCNYGAAVMSPASVNNAVSASTGGPGQSNWWLYCDLQASGKRSYMHSTTKLADWQVALYGGLRYKESRDEKRGTCMVLDNWLQVGGRMRGTNDLLVHLRQETKDAYAWKALHALQGGSDDMISEETERAGDMLRRITLKLSDFTEGASTTRAQSVQTAKPETENRARASREDNVKNEELDEQKDGESVEEQEESEQKGGEEETANVKAGTEVGPSSDVASELGTKTVDELKALLKERGLKVSGRKAELIERLLEG